eukprot:UN29942
MKTEETNNSEQEIKKPQEPVDTGELIEEFRLPMLIEMPPKEETVSLIPKFDDRAKYVTLYNKKYDGSADTRLTSDEEKEFNKLDTLVKKENIRFHNVVKKALLKK